MPCVSNADSSLVGRNPERNKSTRSTQPNENSRHAADTQSEVEREAKRRAEEPPNRLLLSERRSLRFLRNARIGFPHRLQKE